MSLALGWSVSIQLIKARDRAHEKLPTWQHSPMMMSRNGRDIVYTSWLKTQDLSPEMFVKIQMFDGDSVFLRIRSVCFEGAGGEVWWVKFSNGDLVTYLHSLQGGAIKKDYVCGMKSGETYILARQEREFWPAADHNGCHCPHKEGDSTERGADVTLLTINNR